MTLDEDRLQEHASRVAEEYHKSIRTPKQQKEAQLVVRDFRRHGYKINKISDAVFNTQKQRYIDDDITRLVLDWLPKIRETGNRFDMMFLVSFINNLSLYKQEALQLAFAQYRNTKPPDHIIRQIAANIIFELADDSVYDEVLSLARNDAHQDLDVSQILGEVGGRWRIIETLGKMKKHPEVVDELIKLLEDKHGSAYTGAICGLGRLKDPKALPYLKPFLNHERSDVRKDAKTAIAKIETAQKKLKKS